MRFYRAAKSKIGKHGTGWDLANDVQEVIDPWVNGFEVVSPITINTDSNKHTMVKVILTEAEVERLFYKLLEGRQNRYDSKVNSLVYFTEEVVKLRKKIHALENPHLELSTI